ncbi:hypothetical protein [Sediminibacillus halophilus]|uniref:Uncharacterized protein n=1 Tax=Sediminibacillus halophilus TaxID=482461 RepID=A0A1G9Y7X8_9BACI|nr:hypothetical protein [Sediminibacillus halophilus]SDN05188.1 hypothetical protein SAMN05216244_4083 [Sediminibacillus halophilus]
MKQYALLRILLACFFLYVAWPEIGQQTGQAAGYFWAGWLAFFLLVAGANLATLLQMTKPPVMEQRKEERLAPGKN